MLSFTTPWAWLLTVPVVWLWLRRRNVAASRVVPNLFLWTRRHGTVASRGDTSRRLPPWLVWVQTAALIATAAAASGPVTSPRRADAALVLDASASTGAIAGGGRRLDQLRAAARQWLAAQPARARVRLVVAGRTARDAGDTTDGRAAFDGVGPDEGPADFAGAIAMARQATAGRIAVIADRPAPPAAAAWGVEWIAAGDALDNVGITHAVRPTARDILADVNNAGSATVDVTLTVDTIPVPLRLSPGERRAVRVVVGPDASTGDVTLRLTAPSARNALASDDARTLPPPRPVRVAVAPDVPLAAMLAIRAMPQVLLVTEQPDATVCVDCRRATGPWLAVARDDAARQAPPRVLRIDAVDHALFEGVEGADVTVQTAAVIDDGGDWVTLASADGLPLVDARDVAGARRVRVHASLDAGGFREDAVFPILMTNAVRWLAERPREGLSPAAVELALESDLRSAPPPDTDTWPAANATPVAARRWAVPLAILALLLVGVEALLARRRSLALVAGTACLAAAAFEMRVPAGTAPRTVVFAVDGSASAVAARPAAAAAIRADLTGMRPGDAAGVVVFGGGALDTRRPDAALTIDARRWPAAAAVTNVEAGLTAALALLPPSGDRRVTLLTDGHATAGDAVAAMTAARAAGVPVDVVPLAARGLAIARVDAPATSREGLPIDVQADLVGPAGGRVTVSLTRDGDDLGAKTVAVDAQGRARAVWRDTPTRRGLTFYRAAITDGQLGIALSEGGVAVNITGPPSVLVVSTRPASGAAWWPAGTRVSRVTPGALPARAQALGGVEAIVLDGVAPADLSEDQRSALADAVTMHGVGLLYVGTALAANAARFAPSPLSALLPFDFSKAATPPARSRALALVTDMSGSMATTAGGVVKIAAAKDAIARALAVVPREDVVEVIGFAAAPTVLIPAGAPRDAASVTAALAAMRPSGSTAIAPAVAEAVRFLGGTAAESRRVVLLSDGRTGAADIAATRQALAGRGVALSVVSTGDDEELGWLSQLARDTGGQTYTPASLQTLPDDVAQAALGGVTGRVIDARFQVRPSGHPLAAGATAPSLGGYVSAELRPGADAVWRAPNGDAVLAAWSRGLGRVVALASDTDGAWGLPLAAWPARTGFGAGLLAWLARASDEADAELLSTPDGPRLVVVAPRQPGLAAPAATAAIVDPLGRAMTVPLSAVTATRAEAPVRLDRSGEYRAVIDLGSARLTRGWFWSGDAEGRATVANMAALTAWATRGGGRLRSPAPAPSGVFAAPRARGITPPAWAWLLLATAALVFEYARRRARGGLA